MIFESTQEENNKKNLKNVSSSFIKEYVKNRKLLSKKETKTDLDKNNLLLVGFAVASGNNRAEKVIELEATVAEQQPKVEALDRIANADGLMCITDAAKTLGIRPKDLFAWMSARQWIYKRAGNSAWIAYQNRLQQGLLEHKINMVRYTDGSEQMRERVMVAAKGLSKIAEIFAVTA